MKRGPTVAQREITSAAATPAARTAGGTFGLGEATGGPGARGLARRHGGANGRRSRATILRHRARQGTADVGARLGQGASVADREQRRIELRQRAHQHALEDRLALVVMDRDGGAPLILDTNEPVRPRRSRRASARRRCAGPDDDDVRRRGNGHQPGEAIANRPAGDVEGVDDVAAAGLAQVDQFLIGRGRDRSGGVACSGTP